MPRLHIHLRTGIPIEEARGVLRLGVKVREKSLRFLHQPLVVLRAGDPLDKENDMVLRPWGFAVLRLHVVAARVDQHCDIREFVHDVLLCDPVIGVVRMRVVAVRYQRFRITEVFLTAVAVLEADESVVIRHEPFQRFGIRHRICVRVKAVRPVPLAARYPDREGKLHVHFVTSSSSSVK